MTIGRWGAAVTVMAVLSVPSARAQSPAGTPATAATVRLSKAVLRDKIRGGWAAQTIGVTFGGPTEFYWILAIPLGLLALRESVALAFALAAHYTGAFI